MNDELHETVRLHDRLLRGNPENIKDEPGVIAEQRLMSMEQKRTNEILLELRSAVLWIVGLVMTGFVTALIALVYKGHP